MIDVLGTVTFVVLPLAMLLFVISFWVKQYKRCSSNEILVVTGKIGGERAAKCIHGGGQFVWPIVQQYEYLSLDPISFDVNLEGALAKNNIRVNIPCNFTLGISTNPDTLQNAAKRLLGLTTEDIKIIAQDIIFGQLRLVVASMDIEEINNDREKFLNQVNENVGTELAKVGLDMINVNVKDLTDQAGYIQALGKRAAAEAIQKAEVEVATQNKIGDIGVSTANKEREVEVAAQTTQTEIGKKNQEQLQRTQVAQYEAEAVKGENDAEIKKAEYNAELAEKRAAAKKRSEVAQAEADKAIYDAEKSREMARLKAAEVVQEEINKEKVTLQAEAEKTKAVKKAEAEAEAIRQKYFAEAEGIEKVMDAKAKGYEKLMKTFGENAQIAPTMLMIEQMPGIVEKQVQAIKDIKIDKITVWEGGNGSGEHATANFLKGLIGSLPQVHELAKQAGVNLPSYLGGLEDHQAEISRKRDEAVTAARTKTRANGKAVQ